MHGVGLAYRRLRAAAPVTEPVVVLGGALPGMSAGRGWRTGWARWRTW
ncbi:hypothetical protein ACFY0R_33035 [Streptomyces sp. NPDC001633]